MKNWGLFILLYFISFSVDAQDFYGHWEGIITKGKEQFRFEITIEKGSRKTPMVLGCRGCQRLEGSITDYRDVEKLIEFYGIINADQTINLVDAKIVNNEHEEDLHRGRYQLFFEFKAGEPWLTGYWQDYNHKYRKRAQGRIYLKRVKIDKNKA
jgi:hypothetical protein